MAHPGGPGDRGPGSKGRYVKVYDFMGGELGLSGVELLVFARVYGFAAAGKAFYESRAKTARFFGCSRRAVITAVKGLVSKGLILEAELPADARFRGEKAYIVNGPVLERYRNLASGKASPASSEETSPQPVKGVHPIQKEDNPNYR